MAKAYFTLIARDNADDNWSIEFGDYDRETVEYEAAEYKDKGAKTKIIRTADDKQATVQWAVDALNGNGNWRGQLV